MTHNLFTVKPKDSVKTFTIGVAGVTIPGAADCVNKISQKMNSVFEDSKDHPSIILHQPNFGPTHQAQNEGRWDIVENRLVKSIYTLANAGADFAVIPANTVHKVIEGVQKRAPIPVLNILKVVAEKCHEANLKKVGILGTRWTMQEHLYLEALRAHQITEVTPSPEDQKVIQIAIFDELIPTGKAKPETLAALITVIEKLKAQGCDGVILACTELPLILNQSNCHLKVLDTTSLLAEAAVCRVYALEQSKKQSVKSFRLELQSFL